MADRIAKVASLKAGDATPAKMVKALRELYECLERNQPVPAEVCALVAPGIGSTVSALESGQPASLDMSLGLKRHGGASARKALANAERDKLIQQLVHCSPQWDGKPISVISRELSVAFDRYETGRWKREQSANAAPQEEPFSTFWRLKREDHRIPGPNHLRKILTLLFQDPI